MVDDEKKDGDYDKTDEIVHIQYLLGIICKHLDAQNIPFHFSYIPLKVNGVSKVAAKSNAEKFPGTAVAAMEMVLQKGNELAKEKKND